MDIDDVAGFSLKGLGKINIILGKNGCGKSTLLRAFGDNAAAISNSGSISYVTPERSGILIYEAGVEQGITNDPNNLRSNRSKNQYSQFKQQTVARFRRLKDLVQAETEAHVEAQKPGKPVTFKHYVGRLNTLLDEIELIRDDPVFRFVKKGTDQEISPDSISSGESELIALGIESLVFEKEIQRRKTNLLLLDEPDVHLHPDLQVRLMHFIKKQVNRNGFKVIIATHSTAILGALETYDGVRVAFMTSGDRELKFEAVDKVYGMILPVFGAHPLSKLFNQSPILLVEGDDDARIWQQVVRSSLGAIKVYPCVCGDKAHIPVFEAEVKKVVKAVYDNARAYSLRDGDGIPGELTNSPPIKRFRLQCYAAENLLLTDEVLKFLGTDWHSLQTEMDRWLTKNRNPMHPNYTQMKKFKDGGYDRRNFGNVKAFRNLILGGIIGNTKPWEVVVGQVIGSLQYSDSTDFHADGRLFAYLGSKLTKALIPKN